MQDFFKKLLTSNPEDLPDCMMWCLFVGLIIAGVMSVIVVICWFFISINA